MSLQTAYLGVPFELSELDIENRSYFRHCADHHFHLQECENCGLIRYPPTSACPWCSSPKSRWTPVEGRGEVHSYTEVHHAIQQGFKPHLPYMVLLVELDTQRGEPSADEALRVVGNLVNLDGTLASPELVRTVGIGTRVKMVFTDVAVGLALPQWAIDETVQQLEKPWRYPD